MNKYKKKVFYHLLLMLGITAVALVVTIALFQSDGNEHTLEFMSGFTGAVFVIAIAIFVKYIILIRNPEKLKAEAIKDADERNKLIEQNVQAMSFRVFTIIIALLTVILAFIDVDKMFMLSGVLWLALIVKFLLYVYYKRKL